MLNILQTFKATNKEFRCSRYFKTETVYSQCRLKTRDNKTQLCPGYINTRTSNWPDQVISLFFFFNRHVPSPRDPNLLPELYRLLHYAEDKTATKLKLENF
jgi:hypothetical protein